MTNFYYVVQENLEKCEGRGPMRDTPFIFESFEEAFNFVNSEYYATHYGVMGCVGSKFDIRKIDRAPRVFKTCKEALKSVIDDRRKVALAKLTKEEIELLGLSY